MEKMTKCIANSKFKKVAFFMLFYLFCIAKVGAQTVQMWPSVAIEDLNGAAVKSETIYKNSKFTLVVFWATWCLPCKKEMNSIAKLAEEWKKKYQLSIVNITVDDVLQAGLMKQTLATNDWPFLSFWDKNEKILKELKVKTIPFAVILNQEGKIVYHQKSFVDGDEFGIEDVLILLNK